jgi:hypothetical protein
MNAEYVTCSNARSRVQKEIRSLINLSPLLSTYASYASTHNNYQESFTA